MLLFNDFKSVELGDVAKKTLLTETQSLAVIKHLVKFGVLTYDTKTKISMVNEDFEEYDN